MTTQPQFIEYLAGLAPEVEMPGVGRAVGRGDAVVDAQAQEQALLGGLDGREVLAVEADAVAGDGPGGLVQQGTPQVAVVVPGAGLAGSPRRGRSGHGPIVSGVC